MAVNKKQKIAYGVQEPTVDIFPVPIIAKRDPKQKDRAQIGTQWINRSTDNTFVLTSIKSGLSNWVGAAGGSGNFNAVTATNNITSTNGNISSGGTITSVGAMTSASGLVASAGNVSVNDGDVVIDGGASNGIKLGAAARIIDGAGDPNGVFTEPKGSLYLRTDGSGTNNRAYINTDGGTTWTALTTAA